ncbi:MAG: penicillin-binding protein 2 [Dehalococcoidia bacterium]
MRLPSDRNRRWRSRTQAPKLRETSSHRFLFLKGLVVLLFGVLLLQLARIQIMEHAQYEAQAQSNRFRTIPVLPARGLIYDRNGEQLVENEPILSAAVVPADVQEEKFLTTVAELAGVTGVPPQEIGDDIMRARDSNDPFTPLIIKDNLNETEAFQLRERQGNLPGVHVLVESVRQYLPGITMSHILGFVGRIDEEEYAELRSEGYGINDRLGKAGTEYTYEAALRGSAGYRKIEVDAAGQEEREIAHVDPRPAGNLALAVDADLQRKIAEILQNGMGPSQNAAAVVMDVNTGEVLSIVSLPSYDNNDLTDPVNQEALPALLNDPAKPMVNHAVAEVHPPGSTFKQITGTAALQDGIASTNTTITSYGSISVQDEYNPDVTWVMKDWAALGTLDFYRGLAMSSDVYFYYLSGGFYQDGVEVFRGLGAERLASYSREYGLGAPTGIDLPGEASGNVPDPDWKAETYKDSPVASDAIWTLGDTYNFGIGQGYLTVTPIQLVRVTAAIANGGKVLVPHVVHAVVDENGNVLKAIEPEVQHQLSISDQNLGIMREAMRQAAVYGPARTGASSQVTIAAKTGTAEFGQQLANGTYQFSHGWYSAYAPFENPEIAVTVFLEKGIGATNAGPIAKQIFDYYFDRQRLAQTEGTP